MSRTKLHPSRSHMKDDKTSLGRLRWREAPHFLGHGTASLLSRCLHKVAWLNKVIKTETTLSSLDHPCMCAKSFPSCPTLHNPVGCSLSGSSVHGILQVRILEWVAISSSRGSFQARDKPTCPVSPSLACRFFTSEPLGKPSGRVLGA